MVKLQDVLDNKEKFTKKLIPLKESKCFTILGYKDKDGYVSFQFRSNGEKKNIQAHRAAYMIQHKQELTINDVIMHLCDNPCCVNHLHLSKGTHLENVKDRVLKQRSSTGVNNGKYVHGLYSKQFVNRPQKASLVDKSDPA